MNPCDWSMKSMVPVFVYLFSSVGVVLSSAFICQWRDAELLDCLADDDAYEIHELCSVP